ncbi:type II toxin-antitoxin system VapC family toxin [Mesorhizobium xinjiangense]|uniref:type II toxin-antitoxin system VapC family toxin n=1 Tax=Mesorhizobium xinjiangense TaxID=2678685 RepID=UPI0012ED9A9E|nr:type II toxin-antitoxin system VapC family toxin [Mesorhizobium xinjiangense]
MYLLDSNSVIAVLKGHLGLLSRMRAHRPREFAISSIVAHELYYGAYKSQRVQENLARIDSLLFEILPFDGEDARCASEIRADLAAAGTPIGPYDILIAGQALSRGLTLITHNMREFQRIRSLRIEDWEVDTP